MQDGQDAVNRWCPAHFALLKELMREWVHRHTRNLLTLALALSALVAPACGSGESLSYEESMELLESAAQRTAAGMFTFEVSNISVVETEDSPGEYIDTVFVLHYVPERGSFGYQETFNPYAPPKKSHFLATDDGRHYEFMEIEQCFSDNPYLIVSGDPSESYARQLLPPIVWVQENFIDGNRTIEEGVTKEIIEFNTFGLGGTFKLTILDGFLIEGILYVEEDNLGKLVGAGFDGKILAKKYVRRYYDIGVEKEFPAPEPICE
ncbi:MAG: hypothetical protein OXI16_14690 [Chloroflexota bacterium]|nr:hypothetical protein [Chloroflexota bacterium]